MGKTLRQPGTVQGKASGSPDVPSATAIGGWQCSTGTVSSVLAAELGGDGESVNGQESSQAFYIYTFKKLLHRHPTQPMW